MLKLVMAVDITNYEQITRACAVCVEGLRFEPWHTPSSKACSRQGWRSLDCHEQAQGCSLPFAPPSLVLLSPQENGESFMCAHNLCGYQVSRQARIHCIETVTVITGTRIRDEGGKAVQIVIICFCFYPPPLCFNMNHMIYLKGEVFYHVSYAVVTEFC